MAKKKGFKFYPFRAKPQKWKSLLTGNEFDYKLYHNNGGGQIKQGKNDLPESEYPYTIIFDK